MLSQLANSPISIHSFEQSTFYLKRDDLLHPLFSGNKARKFSALLHHDFHQIDSIISYGSAQANSLYSLAALAQIKNVNLTFFVQHIPKWIQQNPSGNYRAALNLGAEVVDLSDPKRNPEQLHPSDYIQRHAQHNPRNLCLPEGGRTPLAEFGINTLGKELLDWITQNSIKLPVIALPSGTGTTALYLQQYLQPHGIEVLTCACVGGVDYLKHQFKLLNGRHFPTILNIREKHHFGKLYQEDYRIWQQLYAETNVEFDLLYDPLMWLSLRPWRQQHPEKTLMYIHQGGILGNESMVSRYQRKYG